MKKNMRMTVKQITEKNAWVDSRKSELQRSFDERSAEADKHGYVFYETDDCLSEEAEESWNSNFSGSFEAKDEFED